MKNSEIRLSITTYIKRADKRRLTIYLFSFLLYRAVNHACSGLLLSLLNENTFRKAWTEHSVPCGAPPMTFLLAFQVFKILLFILFIRVSRNNPNKIVAEFFVAYFIYDFVYLLSTLWDLLPLPRCLNSRWLLYSNGQMFFRYYFRFFDLILAALWSAALFTVLSLQNRLSFRFLISRLLIIPISVVFIFWVIFSLNKLL